MRVVTIASGKGGVGKSTVSLNLALALTERGHRVGLLDADLYGPDIPLMIGLTRQQRLRSWDLWRSSGPVRLEPVERLHPYVRRPAAVRRDPQPAVVPVLSCPAPCRRPCLHPP
jgi:Mrp family chromosome partitioning ATPase